MNIIKRDVWLTYLEGMREALQCVENNGVECLRIRVKNLEGELGNPKHNESKNPLRVIQGYERLDD